jgi:hypothetical protein
MNEDLHDFEQFLKQRGDVARAYVSGDATLFEPEGDSNFEILQMAASEDVACWVGFQRATARMRGSTEAIPVKHPCIECRGLWSEPPSQWGTNKGNCETSLSQLSASVQLWAIEGS